MNFTQAQKRGLERARDYSRQTFSNALKGSAVGQMIHVHDASPEEHEMRVRVSGVDNPSAVTLKRHDKNMLTKITDYPYYGSGDTNASPIYCYAGHSYTFSFDTTYTQWRLMFFGTDANGVPFEYGDDTNGHNMDKYLYYMHSGANGRINHHSNQKGNTWTTTCMQDCIITKVWFWNAASETDKTYSNFVFEEGDSVSEPTTYTVNSDGTVEGVTTTYPLTTLYTDTPGAVIECEYNRDINKAFEEITQAIISLGGNT